MSKTQNSVIINRKEVASDTLEVSITRPSGFSFQAGQYIQLRVPELLHPDPKGASRLMSIASSPLDKDRISIAFRNSGSGFKKTLQELPIGSDIEIEGPHGYFTLPRDSSHAVIFVAGGIGITPFLSMIRFVAKQNIPIPIKLIYANRSKNNAAYLNELNSLVNHDHNLSITSMYGIIDEQVLDKATKESSNHIWYIAGPPGMIGNVRNLLFLMGVDDSRIRFEEFEGY